MSAQEFIAKHRADIARAKRGYVLTWFRRDMEQALDYLEEFAATKKALREQVIRQLGVYSFCKLCTAPQSPDDAESWSERWEWGIGEPEKHRRIKGKLCLAALDDGGSEG